MVTGIGAGTATLTYTVLGVAGCLGTDATSTVDVAVTAGPDAGTASITDANICEGSTTSASSTIAGGTWTSSDASVATVDLNTGLVTGIGAGTATLTYTVSGVAGCLGTDATSTVDVTVTAAPEAGTTSITDANICEGSTTTASSTIAGGTWTSSDATVATIDLNTGLVTGVGAGTVTLTYTVTGSGPCLGVDATASVNISVTSVADPTGEPNQEFCFSNSPTISDLAANGSSITWFDVLANGNAYNNSDNLIDGFTYYAESSNGACISATRLEVTVAISDMQFTLTEQQEPDCGKDNGKIELNVTGGIGNYDFDWSNGVTTSINENISGGMYTLTVTDDAGCQIDTLIRLTCIPGIIPEIITPNGNGKNETWVLNLDPDAEVKIFNRWGSLVFIASPYNDDWDGKANSGSTIGNDYLPSGTYFYVIDKKDGSDPISGYVELVR